MTVTSVSTYGSLQSLLQHINQVQNDLNNDTVQVSSGQKSQTFEGLNGSIEQYTSLNAQVSRMQNYQQNNTVVVSRLQTTNTVLGQVVQIANSMKSLMATQISGTNSKASFTQQLKSSLDSLTGALNTNFQGTYLFSGTKSDTPPIITPVPDSVVSGQPDSGYYQGSTQNSITRISDTQTITNDTRADNIAFQHIIAGVAQAIKAVATGDTASLKNAEDLVSSGIQGSIALQATANANLVTVQDVSSQSQTLQTYYQSLSTTISGADVVAVSTKAAQDQTVLQAAFSTFARISQMTLANYLK